MTNAQKGCQTCQKSTLSLLLLRPGPVAKEKALAPPGANAITGVEPHVQGLLPQKAMTESRPVLRLLRSGYVHLYFPKPPAGTPPWRIFRVTDQADLVPEENALFSQPGACINCTREGHNAAGLKTVDIPMAHKIDEVWVAYSANLWSKALRSKNAANPQVMQRVSLQATTQNTFKPTVGNLKSLVLECAIKKHTIGRSDVQDFPFNTLVGSVEALAAQLESLAAKHPKTQGKELAVVLKDPVGYATELNGLRLRRHELLQEEIEKPENAHPLNSSSAVLGMRQSILDAALAKSFEQVSPMKTRSAFNDTKWPAGTEWRPLSAEERQVLVKSASGDGWLSSVLLAPYKRTFEQADLGRVVYPDHDARAEAWAKAQTEKTWKEVADRYDEAARASWVEQFEARMKTRHYDPLARFEADWRAAATDSQTLAYFAKHFDPADPNAPLSTPSSGAIYARESQYIHTPAPITQGSLRDEYLAMIDKPVTDDTAIVVRALIGNQQSQFEKFQAFLEELYKQATGDPGGAGMRDKAYDFMKGLRNESATLKKFGWLGEALSAFSVGQLSALSAAALSMASGNKHLEAKLARALTKLQAFWGIQQAVELAVQGALAKQAPKVPVIIAMKVSVDEALAALRTRDGKISKGEVKRMRRGGSIQLSLLTDTDALSAAKGDLATVVKGKGGTLSGGPSASETIGAAGSTAILSKEQFLALYARQSGSGAKGAQAVRNMLAQNAADIRAMTLTLEGRLAIGSIIVQGIGLVNGLGALADAKTQKDVRDAWYGIYDSTAGAMGGLLELWAVAVNSRTVVQAGTQGAARSMPLAAIRFAGNMAGAAGGAVNAAAAYAKGDDAKIVGNKSVAELYRYSGHAFMGTAATSSLTAFGVAADWVVARQVGSAVVQRAATAVAVRLGAQGTAAFLGLSVSGWGLVLLGAGVLFQVGAIVLTPTPLQKWMGRSYFGKGDDKYPQGDWKAEQAGLLEAIQEGTAAARQAEGQTAPQHATIGQ